MIPSHIVIIVTVLHSRLYSVIGGYDDDRISNRSFFPSTLSIESIQRLECLDGLMENVTKNIGTDTESFYPISARVEKCHSRFQINQGVSIHTRNS